MSQYETIAGTQPEAGEAHEPRTIKRDYDSELYMMSEVGDGVFVQWGDCTRCRKRVATCTCPEGPQEPDYITRWRDARFDKDVARRMGVNKRKALGLPAGAELPPDIIDPDDTSGASDDPDYGGHVEPITPESSDTRQKVDDGLDKAKAAILAAHQSEEDSNDVGF